MIFLVRRMELAKYFAQVCNGKWSWKLQIQLHYNYNYKELKKRREIHYTWRANPIWIRVMCFHSSLVSLTWLFVWLLCAWELPRVIVELQGGGDVEWSCFVNGSTSRFQFNLLMAAGEWFGLGSQGFSFPSIRCCGGPKSLGNWFNAALNTHTSSLDRVFDRFFALGEILAFVRDFTWNSKLWKKPRGGELVDKNKNTLKFPDPDKLKVCMCVVNDQNDMFYLCFQCTMDGYNKIKQIHTHIVNKLKLIDLEKTNLKPTMMDLLQ